MSVDLKPCPWCEDDTIFDAEIREARHYFCENCGASGPVNDEDGSLWNTRAPDPAVAVLEAEVARLRGALQSALTFIEELAGNDLDETAADGGVTVGMVMQQQASTVFGPRLLAALNPAPSEKEAG